MKLSKNLFTTLLRLLNIKHTYSFSSQYFNDHPYKNTIYGLSIMLSYYQIENRALKFKDKDILPNIDTPFIAHFNNDFVIVQNIDNNTVQYISNNTKEKTSIEKFKNNWSGVVLIVETTENSIEPNYKESRKKEFLTRIKYFLLLISLCAILVIITYRNIFSYTIGLSVSLIINLAGLYISFLLLLKQTKTFSSQANKLCSLLGEKSDCSHILDSDAAKIIGFSWSEIGLGYFFTNVCVILALPSLYNYVALLNIFTLPYTLWSVWYQKYRAKQWCPLCLAIQGFLWVLFINHIFWGNISFTEFTFLDLIILGGMYISTVVLINLLTNIWIQSKEKDKLRYEINSLKSNEEVFASIMKSREQYDIDTAISSSVFIGSPKAKNTLTIVSNPHCTPCAKLHQRIKNIFKDQALNFRIQYILTSFGEKGDKINKLIIAKYLELDQFDFTDFLDEWYMHGRLNEESFIKKYDCIYSKETFEEFQKQKNWVEKSKIKATPTILYNGIQLPQDIYKIEDTYLLTNMSLE